MGVKERENIMRKPVLKWKKRNALLGVKERWNYIKISKHSFSQHSHYRSWEGAGMAYGKVGAPDCA